MLPYILNLAILAGINAILAITLNFIMGYAGIFSLAHAAFFGIGAYTAAYFAVHVSSELLFVIPVTVLVTGLLSIMLALPAVRVRGEYFIAASLGLQMLAVTIFSEWKTVTGGIGGVIDIPAPTIFGYTVSGAWGYLILTMSCLAVVIGTTTALLKSSFGRNLKAIRDSEAASRAAGKNVVAIKTLSVVVSSSLAAIAGAVYAYYLTFINVESFTLDTSVLLMAMVIIGGTATVTGPIVGAVLLMLLPSLFSYMSFLPQSELGSIQQIVYGAAMVLLMIFRPGGLVSSGKREEK